MRNQCWSNNRSFSTARCFIAMPAACERICTKCKKISSKCLCVKTKGNWHNKQHRSETQKLYGSGKWKAVRVARLKLDRYLCVSCMANGIYREASHVDHVQSIAEVGIKQFIKSFFKVDKLQSLCKTCHQYKTSVIDSKLSKRRHELNS